MGNLRIEFLADISGAYICKETGTQHVVGVASDDKEDFHGDRMGSGALRMMRDSAKKKKLPLLPDHRGTFELGHTHDAKLTKVADNSTQLSIDFELHPLSSDAKILFQQIESGRPEKQMSIGGYIPDDSRAIRFEETEDGRRVRVIEMLDLDHVAVTRKDHAANARTQWQFAVSKTIDEWEEKMQGKGLILKDDGYYHDTPGKYELVEDLLDQSTAPSGPELVDEKSGVEDSTRIALPGVTQDFMTVTSSGSSTSNIAYPTVSTGGPYFTFIPQEKEVKKDATTVNVNVDLASAIKEVMSHLAPRQAIEKRAVTFRHWPLERESAWGFDAADGNKIIESRGGWPLFRDVHTWFDPEAGDPRSAPEIRSAYKLPHHKFKESRMLTYLSGVSAATRALLGARGGVDIPQNDRKAVGRHLLRHYNEFNVEPPEGLREMLASGDFDPNKLIEAEAWLDNLDKSFIGQAEVVEEKSESDKEERMAQTVERNLSIVAQRLEEFLRGGGAPKIHGDEKSVQNTQTKEELAEVGVAAEKQTETCVESTENVKTEPSASENEKEDAEQVSESEESDATQPSSKEALSDTTVSDDAEAKVALDAFKSELRSEVADALASAFAKEFEPLKGSLGDLTNVIRSAIELFERSSKDAKDVAHEAKASAEKSKGILAEVVERLSKIEKAGGRSQSLPGTSPAGRRNVEKPRGVFSGLFDGSLKEARIK